MNPSLNNNVRALAGELLTFARGEDLDEASFEKEWPGGKFSFRVVRGVPWVLTIQEFTEPEDETKYGRWTQVFAGPADWLDTDTSEAF